MKYTFTNEVSRGLDIYPESFNTPSETFNSCRELKISIPKPLVNSDKGDEEGVVQNNSSSLHAGKTKCKQTHI